MGRKALYVVGFVLASAVVGAVMTGLAGFFPAGRRIGPVIDAGIAPGVKGVGRGAPEPLAVGGAYGGAVPMPPPTTAYPTEWKGGEEPGVPTAYAGRSLIVRVELTLEVPEGQVGQAAAAVQDIAASLGGWVEHSMVTDEYATVTVKVPAGSLESALSQIRRVGTVKSESRSATDVTDQLVDLDARLRNARAEEQRLLQILERAETVSEILQVEDRLSYVRERIERLEAQKKMLEEQVDYATITVSVTIPQEEPEEPILPGFSLRDLVRSALRALVLAVTIIVVGAAFLAPVVAVGWAILLVYRRTRQRPGGQGA